MVLAVYGSLDHFAGSSRKAGLRSGTDRCWKLSAPKANGEHSRPNLQVDCVYSIL